MEMEKQQYAKPALEELDISILMVNGEQQSGQTKPFERDDDGEETPDDVDVE